MSLLFTRYLHPGNKKSSIMRACVEDDAYRGNQILFLEHYSNQALICSVSDLVDNRPIFPYNLPSPINRKTA
jgi:hypothetical protein